MSKKGTTNQLLGRYALTGAGIGLYFGLFFRPVRQPNIAFTLLLAFIVTVVFVCIRAIRERPSPGQLLKGAIVTYFKTVLLLLLLDARHVAFALGGKIAVTIYATLMGALAGLWYAYDQSRRQTRPRNASDKRP